MNDFVITTTVQDPVDAFANPLTIKKVPVPSRPVPEMAAAVAAYAASNYDVDGWDIVVETMDIANISILVKKCYSCKGAIDTVRRYAKLWNNQRKEVMSTAF